MAAEYIDIFDGNYQHIGTRERYEAHRNAEWHHTFHCWIAGRRPTYDFVLLQLRSAQKRSFPNLLDISAAGHLEAGEKPEDGVRELEEELGVRVTVDDLRHLGINIEVVDDPGGLKNREFAYVYLLRDDRPITEYSLKEDEVSGLVEVPIDAGLQFFSGEIPSLTCQAVQLNGSTLEEQESTISPADIIPRPDNYFLKIFLMAKLFLAGEKYLTV